MDAGAAAGDAAEIRRIVAAANAVGERLAAAFGADVLTGAAAEASSVAGTNLAARVQSAVTGLDSGAGALDEAAGALAESRAQRQRIVDLIEVARLPQLRHAARTTAQLLMTGHYNEPMSSSATGIAHLGSRDVLSSSGAAAGGTGAPDDSTLVAGTSAPTSGLPGTETASTVGAAGPVAPVSTSNARDAGVGSAQTPRSVADAIPAGSVDATTPPTSSVAADAAGPGPSGSGPAGVATAGAAPSAVRSDRQAPTVPGGSASLLPGVIASGVLATGGGSPSMARSSPIHGAAGQTLSPPPGAQAVSAGTPSSSTAPASVPRSGSGASPAMGTGAVRRSDDDERTSADYLRSTREGELLLGPSPLVTPAVLPPPIDTDEGVAVTAADSEAAGGPEGAADQRLDPTL